ncbi:MAG: endonuclease III domain-containing protein [Candidatus Omnitrophota bacterium]
MKDRLELFYKKLYRAFGPQYWWPAKSRFEVIIGAILTQNTSWQNVEKAIANLKKAKALSARKLRRMPKGEIARLIKPSGFFNIKSKRLKEFLRFYFKSYKGDMKRLIRQNAQALRRQLLSVNGIGPETADSILLYALDKPVFVVDAYTKRIFSRHKFIPKNASYDEVQNLFSKNLKDEVKLYNEYHALLVRLAKDYCLKSNPKCSLCPVRGE